MPTESLVRQRSEKNRQCCHAKVTNPYQPIDDIEVEMTSIGQAMEPFIDENASHPGMWSITFQQLLDVETLAQQKFGIQLYQLQSMRDITETIIIPKCQEGREVAVSYAMSLNPMGLPIDAYITHCWDEPFAEFVNSIRNAFRSSPHKPNLWICAFALIQGDHQTLESQLDSPLIDSPFVQALKCASLFVVVRNSKTDLYNRAWCVCGKPCIPFALLILDEVLAHAPVTQRLSSRTRVCKGI